MIDRRCAKCRIPTGVQPGGMFVEYTLHPFVTKTGGQVHEDVAVFCATCFDRLVTGEARDATARARATRKTADLRP